VTGQRTRVPGRDRRRQRVRGEHRDAQRSCFSWIEVADVARDQHVGLTVRGRCEHVTIPDVGELQLRRDRIGRSDNRISDEPDVLLQRSSSMRSIGREQIPTCFSHDKFRPDRSELTGLRSAEEEPRPPAEDEPERAHARALSLPGALVLPAVVQPLAEHPADVGLPRGGGGDCLLVVDGDSAASAFIHRVAGVGDGKPMPPSGKTPLTPEEIGVLRAWIDHGTLWGETE